MKLVKSFIMFLSLLILSAVIFAEPVVIRFWHIYDAGIAQQTVNQVVEEFNKAHEGEIKVESLGISFWDYWDKIRVSIAARQEPDVFLHDLGNVPMRANTGVLLNLSPYLEKADIDVNETFFEAPLNMGKWKEGIYALPFETDVRLLFYNKDLFAQAGLDPERPPQSWDELWQYADKITKKNPQDYYDILGFNPLYGQSYFWMYVWGNDGSLLDENGNLKLNNPTVVKSLEEWKQIIDRLGFENLTEFNATYPLGLNDAFINGKLGMVIQNNTFFSQIENYAPDMNYGVTQIPYPKRPASWSNGFSIEVSSRSKNRDAAVEFALYLVSERPQFLFAQNVSSLVGNRIAANSPELISNPLWKLAVETLEISQFRPFVLEYPLWYDDALQKAVDNVLYGRSTPKKALDDAQKIVDAEIQKYKLTH